MLCIVLIEIERVRLRIDGFSGLISASGGSSSALGSTSQHWREKQHNRKQKGGTYETVLKHGARFV